MAGQDRGRHRLGQQDFFTLDDVDTTNKRVFLRVDINVPIDPSTHQILDDTRIKAIAETLSELDDSKVVLGSHQSRPGKDDFTSLEPHAEALARYCNQRVRFVEDVLGPLARQMIARVQPGEILVLDNLRLCSEENLDDRPEKLAKTNLVKRLAPLFELYINDAFATAHRSQPSIAGFTEMLPSVAGRLMERELRAVSTLLKEPRRPCIYVLGGAKVEDKIPVITHILEQDKADKILLGGMPAKLFLKANNVELSASDGDEIKAFTGFIEQAKRLLKKYDSKIEMPVDLAYEEGTRRIDKTVSSTPGRQSALDIGVKTVEKYSKMVKGASTAVANGPLGVFERPGFDHGTKEILESMTRGNGYTVIGGGHLVGLAAILGIDGKFSHVSTAGGAMLSLLSGQNLPGVDALVRAAIRMRASSTK